jgi:small subunit ribosomal protein S20
MANHKSALKRIHRNHKRAVINKNRISRIRTFIKKLETSIESGKKAEALVDLKNTIPEIHRGVNKGVMHKNTAARKISRLTKTVNALA